MERAGSTGGTKRRQDEWISANKRGCLQGEAREEGRAKPRRPSSFLCGSLDLHLKYDEKQIKALSEGMI